MLEAALEHARTHRDAYLDELFDLLRIPSISTLSEHRADIQAAAEWLAADMRRIGLHNVQVMPTGGHPVVYADWLDAGEGAPTVLIYGHYDVQPVDPLDEWETPPFEPTIRDGRIYARGASDDKGQAFSHVKAIESWLAANGSVPVNVKFLLEGEEEIGSIHLDQFILDHLDLLSADCCIISDGRIVSEDQPSVVYGIRGMAYMEIVVRGPERDLHSGSYGGAVHNPAQALAEIIAALHDENGTVTIPGFYDNVVPASDEERAALAEAPFTLEQWQAETGVEKPWGEAEYTFKERSTIRPTCEVNGIWGGFQGEGGKTIIPAEAGAKISMRLVPDQEPARIADLFTSYVKELAGDDVSITVKTHNLAFPSVTPIDSPEAGAAKRAYEDTWGVPALFTREGGSIPIVATIQRELNAPVVLMGLGLDDNIHSPNEHFSVAGFHRGVEALVRLYAYLADK